MHLCINRTVFNRQRGRDMSCLADTDRRLQPRLLTAFLLFRLSISLLTSYFSLFQTISPIYATIPGRVFDLVLLGRG